MTTREQKKATVAICPQCGRSVNDVPFMPGPNGKAVCMNCAFNFEPRMRNVAVRDAATAKPTNYELN